VDFARILLEGNNHSLCEQRIPMSCVPVEVQFARRHLLIRFSRHFLSDVKRTQSLSSTPGHPRSAKVELGQSSRFELAQPKLTSIPMSVSWKDRGSQPNGGIDESLHRYVLAVCNFHWCTADSVSKAG
jgi:hypothetical protein